MPEEGAAFNAEQFPPREYLMRRSFNPNDAQIPGAVVRSWKCGECGLIIADRPNAVPPTASVWMMRAPYCVSVAHRKSDFDAYPQGPQMAIHAVDVPLVKEGGERWS